ncbi:MAG TPA: hypothetical protein DCM64_03515 [Gammaproteobacteria bacterium]|nr:hypothetical protein [Gammaproteobacteria bacterium]
MPLIFLAECSVRWGLRSAISFNSISNTNAGNGVFSAIIPSDRKALSLARSRLFFLELADFML